MKYKKYSVKDLDKINQDFIPYKLWRGHGYQISEDIIGKFKKKHKSWEDYVKYLEDFNDKQDLIIAACEDTADRIYYEYIQPLVKEIERLKKK